jgi:hypothetical protein
MNLQKIYKVILDEFVAEQDKETFLEWIKKPFIIDNEIHATDKCMLIWFNKNLINNLSKYEVYDKGKIFKIDKLACNLDFVIKVEDLVKSFEKCDKVPIMVPYGKDVFCSECEGNGKVVWEYKNHEKEFDCPKCDGDGYSQREKMIESNDLEISEGSVIKIKDSYLSARKLEKIVNAAVLLGEKEITLRHQNGSNKANLFTFGKVSVIIMPVLYDEHSDSIIVDTY